MHISTANFSEMVSHGWHVTIAIKYKVAPRPIRKVKVNVLHISPAIISKIVIDRAKITITVEYEVGRELSIALFRSDISHCKGQLGRWIGAY